MAVNADDIDDIFNDEDQVDDVGDRTQDILDRKEVARPVDVLEEVRKLSASLPALDQVSEVAEEDQSDLTEDEIAQRDQTEKVILTANAVGKAAVWVIGQGIAAAARGRWHRKTHASLEAYVQDLVPDVVPRQARRWVTGAPVALAITERVGVVPAESQVRGIASLPKDRAVAIYGATHSAAQTAGVRHTAKHVDDLRDRVALAGLPEDPDEAAITLEQMAKELFTGPIGPGTFENSNEAGGEPQAPTPAGESPTSTAPDDIQDAEVVDTPHLDALAEALVSLKAARKRIKRATFEGAIGEGDHPRYRQLVEDMRELASELNRGTRRAPLPSADVPA
ncbi:hypothetical protein [Kitasatospora sp. NPDC087315]|uniref:hypothetical protein n=1 Tax=Kitasatospora sp. NPDC087315 TaxID=3364069 RepID=UPI00381F9227